MSTLSIFISYARAETEQDMEMVRKLISDLRHAGIKIINDRGTIPENELIRHLGQVLPHCHSLLLIQTPQALESARVQTAVGMAMHMLARHHHRLREIWRLVDTTSLEVKKQPFWLPLNTIDVSQGYPKARDQLFQGLGLTTPNPSPLSFPL